VTDRLACFYNMLATDGLAEPSGGWVRAIREAGYDGIQLVEPAATEIARQARAAGLRLCGSGRVNLPGDALRLATEARALGLECLTLHVGWGIEDDDEAAILIEAVLDASRATGIPLFVETHRATIFQDMWRTVQFVRRYPALRFNGDFSHWYTGQEMVYGGFEKKLAFIADVIERTRFLHGRIGDPGCIQVDIGDDPMTAREHLHVRHFLMLWEAVFRAARARGEDVLFAPELLSSKIFYARPTLVRDDNRWSQALLLGALARDAFEKVRSEAAPAA
jgi:sugar phosphate isomerase/epimerase